MCFNYFFYLSKCLSQIIAKKKFKFKFEAVIKNGQLTSGLLWPTQQNCLYITFEEIIGVILQAQTQIVA